MDFHDFHRFHAISWISMAEVWKPVAPCGPAWISRSEVVDELKRSPAPIETFARSWLAAISSIFMIFMDFMRFHGFSLTGWLEEEEDEEEEDEEKKDEEDGRTSNTLELRGARRIFFSKGWSAAPTPPLGHCK